MPNESSKSLSESPPPSVPGEHLSVDEYRRRAALGQLGNSSDFELLEGNVVAKARQSLRHEAALEKLQYVLRIVPEGWLVRVQQPLALGNSQPEPDIALVQKVLDDYATGPPKAEAVAIVVEAADASLLTDRNLKGRIYSRAGILNYWLLNLVDSQLEVFTTPSGPVQMPGYQEQRVYRIEDRVSLVIGLDDLGTIRVGDLIP